MDVYYNNSNSSKRNIQIIIKRLYLNRYVRLTLYMVSIIFLFYIIFINLINPKTPVRIYSFASWYQGYSDWTYLYHKINALAFRIENIQIAYDDFIEKYWLNKEMIVENLDNNANAISIDIKIKDSEYEKIVSKRNEALAKKFLEVSEDDWVNGTLVMGESYYDVKLRLKGDWTDHLEGDKWSFRIKMKGDDAFMGMTEFSIQDPITRNYIHEWVAYQFLKNEGLIALNYDFANISINGQNKGVFAIEEHFTKQVIERNNRREGPILRFNEDFFWRNRAIHNTQAVSGSFSETYIAADISTFNYGDIEKDELLNEELLKATTLLEKMRREELSVGEVFDLSLLARFYASLDVLRGGHGFAWHNIRFYYNPVTGLLEPIGFDMFANYPIGDLLGANTPIKNMNITTKQQFPGILFSDPNFYRLYIQELERMTKNPGLINNFVSIVQEEFEEKKTLLQMDNISYNVSLPAPLLARQEKIYNILNDDIYLMAYFNSYNVQQNELLIQLRNLSQYPIEIKAIYYKDQLISETENITIVDPFKVFIYEDLKINLNSLSDLTEAQIKDNIQIEFSILGSSKKNRVTLLPYVIYDEQRVADDFTKLESNINQFNFILTNETLKTITFKAGNWVLDRNLIIPAGFDVTVEPGFILDMKNKANILSYSMFSAVGSISNPIVIQSSDNTSGGIFIIRSDNSVFHYVKFLGLSNPQFYGYNITSSVTFYESPVIFENCLFANNRSEDALNIIRSEFSITGTVFKDTFADGLDADFSRGKLLNLEFTNIGNDAIDVSGSELELDTVHINYYGDKGISVGEGSTITAKEVFINEGIIGIASKDNSQIEVSNLRLNNLDIGITAFQKKKEYGPGKIVINQLVDQNNIKELYLLETGSEFVLDNVTKRSNSEDLVKRFYD